MAAADVCELKVNPTLTKGHVSIEVPALDNTAQLGIYDLNGHCVYHTEGPAGEADILPYNYTHKGFYRVKFIGQEYAAKVTAE